MRVEQLHKQVFFEGISSRLWMYKTSAVGMLFEVFLCLIQQLKRMTITSNTIKHYQFSSCLRPYLLAKTPIRCPKVARTGLRDATEVCRRTRGCSRNTIDSVAAYARKQGIKGRFECKNLQTKHLRLLQTSPNGPQSTVVHGLTNLGATKHA